MPHSVILCLNAGVWMLFPLYPSGMGSLSPTVHWEPANFFFSSNGKLVSFQTPSLHFPLHDLSYYSICLLKNSSFLWFKSDFKSNLLQELASSVSPLSPRVHSKYVFFLSLFSILFEFNPTQSYEYLPSSRQCGSE